MTHKSKLPVIVFLLLSIVLFKDATYAEGSIILKNGMQSSQVLSLQRDLKQIGYFEAEPTGYFGVITENAVKRFQKEHNLTQDGIVGPQTMKILQDVLNKSTIAAEANQNTGSAENTGNNKNTGTEEDNKPLNATILKKGMENDDVVKLQEKLIKLCLLNSRPTGYFGDLTHSAVIRFQREHGLTPDGIAGPKTIEKLEYLLGKPTLNKGMSGSEVSILQNDLKKLGFFEVEPTGNFGDITEESVKKFQGKYNLEATGIVDLLTFSKIDSLLMTGGYNGISVVIDPGHGGIDSGTAKNGLLEKDIVLDISKKLKNILVSEGYNVILTRETDTALHHLSNIQASREIRDLNARTNIINESQANMFVSIHVNSLSEYPSVSGSIVFYNPDIPKSKTLAQNIQKALNEIVVEGVSRQSQKIKTAEFYVLENSEIPGVLVETAFITNPGEFDLLKTDEFRKQLAEAIALGIRNTD